MRTTTGTPVEDYKRLMNVEVKSKDTFPTEARMWAAMMVFGAAVWTGVVYYVGSYFGVW